MLLTNCKQKNAQQQNAKTLMIKQSVTRMQSLARLAKERLVNASRTQLSKQVLMQTNHHHHHVHTPDEEGGDGDASPSMS